MRDGAALKPQVRDGAAIVLDIVDFTGFSAERPPEEVIRALNDFLAVAAEDVAAHSGVVISFTGDGLLAAFNAPLAVARPETAAIDAARALRRTAAAAGFDVRIGVAVGPLAAGSVGSARRRAFTVYGDTVNRAARLEALGKPLGESLLLDADAARDVDDARPLGAHALRGSPTTHEVFAV